MTNKQAQRDRRVALTIAVPLSLAAALDLEAQDTQESMPAEAVHRAAYPQLPEEIQLLWYKDLLS
jgi:hypothetical protein